MFLIKAEHLPSVGLVCQTHHFQSFHLEENGVKRPAVSVQSHGEKEKKLLFSNLQPELVCAETLLAPIFVLPLN